RRDELIAVLLELLAQAGRQVVPGEPGGAAGDLAAYRLPFGARDHVLEQSAGHELAPRQRLAPSFDLPAGDVQRAPFRVAGAGGAFDQPRARRLRDAARVLLARRDRQLGGQVLAQDRLGRGALRAIDLDLDVEAAGAEDRGIEQVLAVRGADQQHVAQLL